MNRLTTFLLTTFLLVLVTDMHAMDIGNVHSGSWWNAAQSGHGISVEVLDNETMVIYWFDYNPDGSPTFLITVADIDGDTATGNTFCYSGMKFGEFDPAFLKEEVWGTTSITFFGCDEASMTYDSVMTYKGDPFGSGTIDLTRLTSIQSLECHEPQLLTKHGNYIAEVKVDEADVGEADIMILKDGTLAYLSTVHGGLEAAVGQVTMTSPTAFTYEAVVSFSIGPLQETISVFEGSGNFASDLELEMPRDIYLEAQVDPASYDGIELAQIVGNFRGSGGRDGINYADLHISEDGTVVGVTSFDCPVIAKLTLPDKGVNQFRFDATLGGACTGVTWKSVGRLLESNVLRLITLWKDGEAEGVWVLDLNRQ